MPQQHCLGTLHLLGTDVVIRSILQSTNGHTATNLGEQSQTKDSHGNGDLLVARDGSLHNQLAHLALNVEEAAAIGLTLGTAAQAGKHGGAKLEAKLAVEAADTGLSGASEAVRVHVETAVGAADGAAQHDVFFVNGIVGTHLGGCCCC